MTTALIEINDAGLSYSIDGDLIGEQPGYAVLDGKQLLLGKEARESAKLLPSWTNNKFWGQLSTDPIANATHKIRHHADLAFAQLESIRDCLPKTNKIILSVPSYYEQEQLGLLLGMAGEANLNISGLVDNALLSVIDQASTSNILYLDIGLHKITLSQLNLDAKLNINETQTIIESGLTRFWDRWSSIIANQFIQTSRFDPMHQANSEQRLFDLIPNWIEQDEGQSSRPFELEIDGVTHVTQISNEQLLAACSTVYPNIIQNIRQKMTQSETTEIFVSHRFAGFPKLINSLGLVPNLSVHQLRHEHCRVSASVHRQALISDTESVPLIKHLESHKKTSASYTGEQFTHILVGHTAFEIGQELNIKRLSSNRIERGLSGLEFSIKQHDGSLHLNPGSATPNINGKPAKLRSRLKLGDIIALNNIEARCIRLE